MSGVELGKMTVREVRDYLSTGSRTVLLPYGIVEQHGYHLPLDTDIQIAAAIAGKIAVELPCLVAPSLNYCFSGGMLPGTVNVRPNTFSSMVCDIIESLAGQGFENIIVLPGHAGSESLTNLRESLRVLKWLNPLLQERLIMLIDLFEFSPTWAGALRNRDYHAAMIETALLLHLSPGDVRPGRMLDKAVIAERLRDDPDSYQVKKYLTKSNQEIPTTRQDPEIEIGVMGFPEQATTELGEKVFKEIIANAVPELRMAVADAARKRI